MLIFDIWPNVNCVWNRKKKYGNLSLFFLMFWESSLSYLTSSRKINQAQKVQESKGAADHQQNADRLQALHLPRLFKEHQHDARATQKTFQSSSKAAYNPPSATFTTSHSVIVCNPPGTCLYNCLHAISVHLSQLLGFPPWSSRCLSKPSLKEEWSSSNDFQTKSATKKIQNGSSGFRIHRFEICASTRLVSLGG